MATVQSDSQPGVLSDSWLEWAVHNLAQGVSRHDVIEALTRSGIAQPEAERNLSALTATPAYRAAARLGAELRKWNSLGDALLELQEQDHDFNRIPRVKDLPAADFRDRYYVRNLPVIIEDYAQHWPALTRWTLDYLGSRFGHEEVTWQSGRGNSDYRHAFVDHGTTAPLAHYIALIANGDETNDYYLIAHDRLLDRQGFAPLFEDMIFDDAILDPEAPVGKTFFWLGPRGAVTPLHRDLGNVFLIQIMGRKEVTMIPSMELHRVYNETGYHSEVDFEHFDPEVHPRLAKARRARDVIHPGEMLFIPMGWWHHIKALDPVITVTGNNFKFRNSFTAIF